MTGQATATGIDVSFWGNGSSHWYLEPPLDGYDYIVICDRTALLEITQVEGEPPAIEVPTLIPTSVEVFPALSDGTLAGSSMSTLREPISLMRPNDRIDIDQILSAIGYSQT